MLAALAQAFRSAGQKKLSETVGVWGTTFARYWFALPLVWLYLMALVSVRDSAIPEINTDFVIYSVGTSLAQIAASAFVVKLFQLRNFAIGIIYSKSEAVIVAVIGAIVFAQYLTAGGWLSVLLGLGGLVLLNPKTESGGLRSLFSVSVGYGLASGFCFALTALWSRQASLSLGIEPVTAAGFTLAATITLQAFLLGSYIAVKEPETMKILVKRWKLGGSVGVLSLVGSIGWFTAFSLQNPALVKTLGQVEFFFALLISTRLFKEKHSLREYIGMALILTSVITLLWLG